MAGSGCLAASSIQAKLVGSTVDPYTYDQPYNGSSLDDLPAVTPEEVARILTEMPCKSSPMDFIPTSLLKSCSDFYAPIIARLANLSFAESQFPTNFKRAQITPLLKKEGLDNDSPANYRPISNLNTKSKIIENLFLNRLKHHISLLPDVCVFQSAYKAGHFTEIALLKSRAMFKIISTAAIKHA